MNKKHVKRQLAAAALVLLVAGAFLAPSVFAKIGLNTIDPLAHVSAGGGRIRLTGPISGTAGELCLLCVTVTQRSTGAVAEGTARFRLNGETQTQQWEVIAHTIGNARFVPGSATAVAVAQSRAHGEATDAHQWLVNVTLQGQ